MSLKTKWFEMTKAGIKTEDYREIAPYWIKRLVDKDIFKYHTTEMFMDWYNNMPIGVTFNHVVNKFNYNIMTLGYPKSTDTERILKLEHNGIEIGYGKEEWGAESNKLYFIIKHGAILNQHS